MSNKIKWLGLVATMMLGLSACGGGATAPSSTITPTTGVISGKLFVGPTSAQTVIAAGAVAITPTPSQSKPAAPEFVLGQVIVQLKGGTNLLAESIRLQGLFPADGLVQVSTIPVVNAITFSSDIAKKYQAGTLTLFEAKAQTQALLQRLQADAQVKQASLNHINKSQAVPNDPQYSQQWHYRAIRLEQAWDITTGSANVIVAVLDTGIFPHPDLKPNLIAGYDFVSDPISAGDGNGIDPDPTAVATSSATDDAFHGTHVAGTIAAASNNRIGVAGVAWQSKIMPIRVLGNGGGTNADIMNGIAYAAGLANSSGTVPAKRADIINMSLGGPGLNPFMQQVIDAAMAAGVTVIAAAGNDALKGNPVNYPCAYNNVICVGAIALDFKRASYSEFNQFVDIVAPGGEMNLASQAGIMSTGWKNGVPEYTVLQGTSMATPHIAGVAALMLAANPALTPVQIEQMLITTTWDLGTVGKDNEYGFGLVNAYHAVVLAKGLALTVPQLSVDAVKVHLDTATTTTQTTLRNIGGGAAVSAITATSGAPWLMATLNQTTTPATLALTANPVGQTQTVLTTSVAVSSNAGSKSIQVTFDNRVFVDPGVVTVQLMDLYGATVASTTTSKAQAFAYQFNNIAPGDYFIAAGVDRDGSGDPSDNWDEFFGIYPLMSSPAWITVAAGSNLIATNFQLQKSNDVVRFDGNGKAPIRGAILARVNDSRGNPITGAKIYVGNGTVATGTTDGLGESTLLGVFNGAQTVTATAPGYATLTYWNTNASYLTFPLAKLTTANVPLNVTLNGLTIGETGIIFVDSAPSSFTATAASLTFAFTQQNNTPLAISAITYNALGAPNLFGQTSLNAGITAATNVALAMAAPVAWAGFTGSLNNPVGNFSLAGLNHVGFGFVYTGLDQPLFINGYQAITNPAAIDLNMAFTNDGSDPYANALVIGTVNAVGESSMVMQFGSLLPSAPTALPVTGIATLLDVPALVSPLGAATTPSITPTFSWTNTFVPSMQVLNIQNPTTNQTVWEIDMSGSASAITLPAIPTGGLQTLTAYQWNVDDMVMPNFDFNHFNAQLAVQSTTDFTSSQIRAFVTP